MSKRARYSGPFPEVDQYDADGTFVATVKHGGMLPADAPASLRDELLKREDWTEVNQPSPKKRAAKKKPAPQQEPESGPAPEPPPTDLAPTPGVSTGLPGHTTSEEG